MPTNTPQISLDNRLGGGSDPGWRNVTVGTQRNGYCYTGGDDSAGGLIMHKGQGRDVAPLNLVRDQRYQIQNVVFTGDTQNQLAWNGNSGRAGSIVDANTQVENAEYTVMITDTGNGNCTIPCDPPIKNQP